MDSLDDTRNREEEQPGSKFSLKPSSEKKMELTRVKVGLLSGKANWSIWKFKVSAVLRGIQDAMDIVEGRLTEPQEPPATATEEVKTAYRTELQKFRETDSNAMIVLTNNLSDEDILKIMRFSNARDVWLELHRLYDGSSEDKAFDLCHKFFSYQRQQGDDIASHTSKLKNLWNDLKQELKNDNEICDLPDIFLICKILGTLSDEYFSFKSSWMLMAKSDRTIESLTSQLCAHERALGEKQKDADNSEVLATGSSQKTVQKKKSKSGCKYCGNDNHVIKKCRKWIEDGRPPKPSARTSNPSKSGTVSNVVLLTETAAEVLSGTIDSENWYVDSGATSHITNRRDLFQSFEKFPEPHSVTTANGESVDAIGKGNIELDAIVNELLSDNGGEFDNANVRLILQQNGIRQRLTMPYTPEQNGCCERDHRTVVEAARSLMHAQGDIPQGLWAEMINTAAYILNRTGPSGIVDKSPFELWYGKKPSIKNLRIIGSICYAHVPKQLRKKLSKKAIKGILIGYDYNDGYRIWSSSEHRLIRSRDVIFDEEPLKQIEGPPSKLDTDNEDDDEGYPMKKIHPLDIADQQEIRNEVDEDVQPQIEQEIEQDSADQPDDDAARDNQDFQRVLRDRATLKKPIRFEDFVMSAVTDIEDLKEPETFKQAMNSQKKEKWIKAMQSEMDSLRENGTWTLEELPPGRKPIPCKWVYKLKMNPDGSIDRFKARLVVKGFTQRKGIDYDQTFSPVAKAGTLRALLSVAAEKNMLLMQFDVSTAFLYGYLNEEIYMKQPEGYDDKSGRVCRLRKSLYGLKQAPRCWNQRFANYLQKMGFKPSEADPCLFLKHPNLMVALYVDDGIVASTSEEDQLNFLEELKKEFKIVAKPATYYLGFEINKSPYQISVTQKAYLRKVLEKFGMSDCRPVSTPMVKDSTTRKPEEQDDQGETFPYRQAVGALMYLMVGTRPDIAYSVGVVSRTLENPKWSDWLKVKRIFRYLKGTSDMGLLFTGCDNTTQLETFSDADHGGGHNYWTIHIGSSFNFFQWRDIVAKPATGFSGNIYYRSRNRGCQRGCERNGLAEEVTQGHGSRQRKTCVACGQRSSDTPGPKSRVSPPNQTHSAPTFLCS
ncbi:unnamed protein product [Nesidiocoris tenuis]|uniref:Integrase catalytic domain-containing protein n=1 Tax=Nesidiocoris tenuis TaxID=355587 RepID=A0A6H5FZ62_9HEMI|nr:unnamed protein product [Nesidiocoris tenuis]